MAQLLAEVDSQRLHKALLKLLARSESDDCLICDTGGHVLALEGASQHDPFLVSALGAGVFGADELVISNWKGIQRSEDGGSRNAVGGAFPPSPACVTAPCRPSGGTASG